MAKKLHAVEPLTYHEYWTAVEEIVEWAGEQHLVVQLPLPLDASRAEEPQT